jgi:thiamine kinase-like enzyme
MKQSPLQSLIPETKLATVEKALHTAFNTTTVESIMPLTGGRSSALVYKIMVRGKLYLLRLVMETDQFRDPIRQHISMNIAAEAGIAPHVYYAEPQDGLSITDFIETIPLSSHFASQDALLFELVKTIKSIHATPLFPKLVDFLDGIDLFIQQFKALKLLPDNATEEHFRYYSQIQQVYPRHGTDLVSSHNDLNPSNILFDGKKIWIVDWESAFQNDRYADLAIVANFFVLNEAQEEVYLKAYFGDSLDEYQKARFFLMRQVCYMFYAMMLLKLAATLRTPHSILEESMDTPRYREFREQIGSGKISSTSFEGHLLFGKVLLNEALYNMKMPRFAESMDKITS